MSRTDKAIVLDIVPVGEVDLGWCHALVLVCDIYHIQVLFFFTLFQVFVMKKVDVKFQNEHAVEFGLKKLHGFTYIIIDSHRLHLHFHSSVRFRIRKRTRDRCR